MASSPGGRIAERPEAVTAAPRQLAGFMSRLLRDGYVRGALAAFILSVVAGIAMTVVHHRFAASGGLRARYIAGEDLGAPAALDTIDRELTDWSIKPHREQMPPGGTTYSVLWNGYLIAPSEGAYRFWVPGCVHSLTVDKRLMANDGMPSGGPPATLSRGMHGVDIQLTCDEVPAEFHVEWALDDGAFRSIHPLLLIPEVRERREVRARQWTARTEGWLPIAWLSTLILLIAAVVSSHLRAHARVQELFPPGLAAALAVATVVFVAGVWWGIPDIDSWAADEVVPSDVQYIVAARFAHGWATIYPPLHYAVLALAFVPFQIAGTLGLTNLQDAVALGSLLVVGRLVSTAMALGIVWTCYRIGADIFSRQAGILAAAVMSVSVPMAYYSKTTNLDVPYVFWLMCSLLFYLRAAKGDRARDYYLFALFATAWVYYKDQVYGFYVIPAFYIALGQLAARRGTAWPGVPSFSILLRMVLIAVAAFALFHNLLFNFNGFREHLRLMTDLEGFRMVPRTIGGLLTLSGTAIEQIGNAMSWPLLAASACGIVTSHFGLRTAPLAPRTAHFVPRTPHFALLLLLPALSYHFFFICVVLYHYDRFFLGVIAIFAIFAGACLDGFIRTLNRHRVAALGLVVVLLGYALTRAASLDLLMMRDSRYDAERWLRAHVIPQQRVVSVGFSSYLPRRSMVPWTFLKADRGELATQAPDVVIVNTDFARRSRDDSEGGAFYTALANGAAGYDRAAEFHTRLAWPFNLDLRFGRDTNEGFSNLPKINPPIVIYVRRRS